MYISFSWVYCLGERGLKGSLSLSSLVTCGGTIGGKGCGWRPYSLIIHSATLNASSLVGNPSGSMVTGCMECWYTGRPCLKISNNTVLPGAGLNWMVYPWTSFLSLTGSSIKGGCCACVICCPQKNSRQHRNMFLIQCSVG